MRDGVGLNRIPEPERKSLLSLYLEKFKDPLIIILCVILVLSCFVTAYEISQTHQVRLLFEPVGIFLAILLSTGIGFIFEVKANREFDIRKKVRDEDPVKVVRSALENAASIKNMMNDSFKACGSFLGFLTGSYIDRHYLKYEIPVGAANLPILTCIGASIIFSWKELFAPATVVAAFGGHWGNTIARFIMVFFALTIWPTVISKICKNQR